MATLAATTLLSPPARAADAPAWLRFPVYELRSGPGLVTFDDGDGDETRLPAAYLDIRVIAGPLTYLVRQHWAPDEKLDLALGWAGDTLLGRGAGGVTFCRATEPGGRSWLHGMWATFDLTPHGALPWFPAQIEFTYAVAVVGRFIGGMEPRALQTTAEVGSRWMGPYVGVETKTRIDATARGHRQVTASVGIVLRMAIDTDVMTAVPVADPGQPPVEWGDPAPRTYREK